MRFLAHGSQGHVDASSPLWQMWHFDPIIIFNLLALTLFYSVGIRSLWKKRGRGATISPVRAFCFYASILMCALALLSPIDVMAESLSWAHMVQHLLIMAVAAPLFILGAPGIAYIWALPQSGRKKANIAVQTVRKLRPSFYFLIQPILLWGLYAATLWIWHLPSMYQWALGDKWIHDLQHLSFFASACLFWRVLLDPVFKLKLGRGVALIYIFATSLHATLLGVFMALAPSAWYQDYVGRTQAWNLNALEDQQLAGLIMWMPACAVYVLVTAFIFYSWLADQTKKDQFLKTSPR